MKTIASIFSEKSKNKYPDPTLYKDGMGPGIWDKINKYPVKYEITFKDYSKIIVIMTNAQYYGLRRSIWNENIGTIGGLGYQQLVD